MPKVLDITGLDTIEEVLPDFERSLVSERKSPRTIESYLASARLLDTFLAEKGMPRQLRLIGREHVETFQVDQIERWKPATAAVRYRSLQQFFRWAKEDGEITESPMANMKPPKVEAPEVPVIGQDAARALFKSCDGKTFEDYRDAALLRLFYDTGARLSEITMLQLQDVDTDGKEVSVLGKGRRHRRIPFGDATRKALRQYLKARATHQLAATDWLWLGSRGQQLTQSGIAQILRRRCLLAGIGQLHPHQFRHSAADSLLRNGMSENDAMRLFGWTSRDMLTRYAASTGNERARDAYRRQGAPGDQL